MNNSSYWISLDIHDTASQAVLAVKKGDNCREITASLTENGKEYAISEGCTAVFTAKKPDGKKLYNDCVIENNSIKYVVTNNTTSAVGLTECEFRLIDPEDKLLVCPRFSLLVEDTVVNDDDVMDSSDEFSALSKMVGKVERADSVAQEALETAEEAVERAESTHGLYVGSGDMPEGYDIQIDPTGEAVTVEDWIRTEGHTLLDMVYPVGSIYMSTNDVDPSVLFGGTWERLKDRFLLGAGNSCAAGSVGGENTHTLTVEELPSHNHGPVYTGETAYAGGVVAKKDLAWYTESGEGLAYGYTFTGGGQEHNNMPPYLAVYMWKRTA